MGRNAFNSVQALACVGLTLALSATTTFAAGKKPPAGSGNWSSGTAISSVLQPDPRGGPQLCDTAVNSTGLTVSAWDQYTYNNGGGATIGVAVPHFVPLAIDAKGNLTAAWTFWDGTHSLMQTATRRSFMR